jgi:predicted lipoprotein with Yx(FWY)xxD motif
MAVAGICGVAVAALVGIAAARTFTLTVANNVKVGSKHESIVANSHGVTVYELIPATKQNPRCTGSCLGFWPPLTVASAHAKLTKAPGIKGKLSIWHRGHWFQVLLSGHPLYTFKGDGGMRGVASGNGQAGPGGATWHVIRVSAKSGSPGPGTPSGTTTTNTMPPPVCLYPPCY